MTANDAPAPSAYGYPLLIRHLLHTPLATAPRQEIVHADGARYDYATFAERVARLASGLAALGVRRGQTVAVMSWDTHCYLECFFAVPMLGAVLHTVNIRLSPEQILYTVNHAEDDIIIVHDDFAALLAEIAPRIERPVKLVRMRDGDAGAKSALAFDAEYEALLAGGDPRFEFEDFDERTRATTFYTTGTTGEPKGVHYCHRQIVLHTLGLLASYAMSDAHGRFGRADVYMPITPMFHVHAWGKPYAATLMGVKQVYPGRYEPEKLLALIEREGVTFSHCVPTILHMLLSSPAADSVDLSRWKVIIGGSALPLGLARAAYDRGIDVFCGYGLSETCPVVSLAHLEADMLDSGSDAELNRRLKCGRPMPLVDLRIVDGDMNDVPHDGESTGEVVLRAPWITQGYFKNPEASAALWRGGYLHTGDMGHIDADGYLKVTDRVKDVIKSGGEWISSILIEDIVSRFPGVSEAAAIGVPDERWGERPLVLVVPAPGAGDSLDCDAIREHVRSFVERGELTRWAVPERIELVDSIDKTSVGKINKKKLRERYAR